MKTKILYRYKKGQMIIDSLTLPEGIVEWVERYRIVADVGMALTKDGTKQYKVIDIDQDQLPMWQEVEKVPEVPDEE